MTAHALLSPSSAHRWTRCPGSVELCKDIPNTSSEYAAEGTVFHSLLSAYFEFGVEPKSALGRVDWVDGFRIEVTKEMVGHAYACIDRLEEQDMDPATLRIERRVSLEHIVDNSFGTVDVSFLDRGGDTLTVWDWKYGAGVRVDAEENEQLLLYALGVWRTLENRDYVAGVRLVVCQPRIGEPLSEWTISSEELEARAEKLGEAAGNCIPAAAPRIPGEKQCQFCLGKNICPEFDKFHVDALGLDFEDLDAETPPKLENAMTPERRSYVIKHAGMIRKWLEGLTMQALDAALRGEPTPGLKVILGREGHRQWADGDGAAKMLAEAGVSRRDIFEEIMISPAEAEKLLGKKTFRSIEPDFNKFVKRSPGKPTLVDVNHKSPAWSPAEFENLDQ